MKQTSLLLFIIFATAICLAWKVRGKKPPEPVKINGNVYGLGVPYKNANHLESWPISGVKIYVRPFRLDTTYIGPIADSIVSDSLGNFSIMLTPGFYSFISAERAKEIGLTKHFKPAHCDSICYKQQLDAGNMKFQVKPKDNSEVQIMVSDRKGN
jgi:hypothetical protein